MPRMASRANPRARPSRSPWAGAVGIVAAAASTVALLVTVLAATADPPITLVVRGLPAWMIALGLLAGLAVTGAAWMVSIERPAVAVALAVTSAGLLVPTWAGIFDLSPAAQTGALAAAPLAVAGVSHVGLRWSRAVGTASSVRVIYALAIAAVVVLAAGYDPLTDPGCNLTCAEVQPPAAALHLQPRRLRARDGPGRGRRGPCDARARPGGGARSIRWGRVGLIAGSGRPGHVVDRPRGLVDESRSRRRPRCSLPSSLGSWPDSLRSS